MAAALGDLSPRQSLHAQFKGALVAFAGLDDTRLNYHATHSRAVLLLPVGGVEQPPALGIRTQACTERLVADPHHERLECLQRRNRARRRVPDRCHSLPVRIEDVNSRVISTANAPRTRRLAARRVQVVSPKLSHRRFPLRPVSPSRHGPFGAGTKRIFTDGGADCPLGRFLARSPSCGTSDNDSPHPHSAWVAARSSLLPPAPQASGRRAAVPQPSSPARPFSIERRAPGRRSPSSARRNGSQSDARQLGGNVPGSLFRHRPGRRLLCGRADRRARYRPGEAPGDARRPPAEQTVIPLRHCANIAELVEIPRTGTHPQPPT